MRRISTLPVVLGAVLATAAILAYARDVAPNSNAIAPDFGAEPAATVPTNATFYGDPCTNVPDEPDCADYCGRPCKVRSFATAFPPRSCRCASCGASDGRESPSAFNCCCRGSYKYPVPPQYTYFWPGIYSQPTMTGCLSPYRYVPLAPLDEPAGENGVK